MDQRYVIDQSVQHGYVGNRDARTFLPFLLPHLRPGLDALDLGCGVGSIALDLAPGLAPGHLTGIDADGEQIDAARASAAERGLENVAFTTGSVLELPFDDASFDVVYANAVLLYVPDRVRALREMRRVLRPGGVAAVADDDLSTFVVSPDLPELRRGAELFERAVVHEGGDPRYSRHLRSLFLEAGFARAQGLAHAPETYGDAESTRWFAEFATGLLSAAETASLIVSEGWATRAELDATIAALDEGGHGRTRSCPGFTAPRWGGWTNEASRSKPSVENHLHCAPTVAGTCAQLEGSAGHKCVRVDHGRAGREAR